MTLTKSDMFDISIMILSIIEFIVSGGFLSIVIFGLATTHLLLKKYE